MTREQVVTEKEALREIAKVLSEIKDGNVVIDSFNLGRLYEMLRHEVSL